MKKVISALLLVFIFILAGCGQKATQKTTDILWIDTHTHPNKNIVTVNTEGGEITYCFSEECLTTAMGIMDATNTKQALLMSPPGVKYDSEYEEQIQAATEQYPERFIYIGGGATLNPLIHKAVDEGKVSEELRETFRTTAEKIATNGAVAFGEMAVLHLSMSKSHSFEEAPADHELYLLLADIAAEHNIPIDLHMDLVAEEEMQTPEWFIEMSKNNPETLQENLAAFERLLDYNTNAQIVWAHVGSDTTGVLTPTLVAELLEKHPNLIAQLRLSGAPGESPYNILYKGKISEEWVTVLTTYPDRFTLGTDTFFGNEEEERAQKNAALFLSQLPEDVAVQVGCANAVALYNLAVSCQ